MLLKLTHTGFSAFIAILLAFVLGLGTCFSQNARIDSLKSLIDSSKSDTTQVNVLNDLSYSVLNHNPDEAIKYGVLAREMAELLGYDKGKAYSLKNVGLGYYYQGNYLKVLDYWTQSLETFENVKDTTGIANMLNNLGAIYYTQGSNSKAIEFFLRSLRIAEDLGDSLRIAAALVNVGGLYSDNEKDYHKALKYFWQIEKIAEKYTLDDQSLGGYLTGIGEVYKNMGDYDSSLYYLQKALPLYENTVLIPEALIRLGMVQEERKQFETAIKYQKQAYQTAVETDQNLFKTRSLLNLGNVYRKVGNLTEAQSTYFKAETHALEGGLNYELRDIYQGLSQAFAEQKAFKEAYEYHTKHLAIKDTLFNLETDDKVRGLQFTYEIDKKQDQIEILEKDSEIAQLQTKRQKAISIGAGVAGILMLLLAGGIFHRYKFIQKINTIIKKEKDRSENLLLNILPSETAEELKEHGKAKARSYESVSILFTDFKGFTGIAASMSPEELVHEIHENFQAFDEIITKYNVEKIKTIGDAYMAAGGLPIANETHALDVASAALEIRDHVEELKLTRQKQGKPFFEIRIGIHTGPVVSGIVGTKKFAYDIWGDSVNIASRMESNSEPGKINISQSTYELVKKVALCTYRGEIEAKNRGKLKMYFLDQFKEPHTILTSDIQETI